jgi:hypothetical protein
MGKSDEKKSSKKSRPLIEGEDFPAKQEKDKKRKRKEEEEEYVPTGPCLTLYGHHLRA